MKIMHKWTILSCLSLLFCAGCTEPTETESYWEKKLAKETHYDVALFKDDVSLGKYAVCPVSDYSFRNNNLVEITTTDGLKLLCSTENIVLISTENYTGTMDFSFDEWYEMGK